MVDHIVPKISDDYKQIVIDAVVRPQGFKAKLKGLMLLLAKFMKKVMDIVINPDTWKKKKSWIFALIFFRCAYVFMNEYGMNPIKKSLKGDHVFLTGAGSGIGQGMAIKLGKLGCKLSLSDINLDGLKSTQDLCIKAGISVDQICIFVCDVSQGSSIKEGAAKARAAFGEITILINNAGIVSGKNTQELSDAMIDRTVQVNTISHLHTIKEFLPGMIAQ
jgi:all-trans-retinol dehydrogenase (NAD+)